MGRVTGKTWTTGGSISLRSKQHWMEGGSSGRFGSVRQSINRISRKVTCFHIRELYLGFSNYGIIISLQLETATTAGCLINQPVAARVATRHPSVSIKLRECVDDSNDEFVMKEWCPTAKLPITVHTQRRDDGISQACQELGGGFEIW